MPHVSLRFRPSEEVSEEPHVVVDGSPTGGTTLTLSHWPGAPPLPKALQADLSAEMAFRYLGHDEVLHGRAGAVTNNHFDQDGLVGVHALTDPDEALPRRDLLEDVAAAGDFGTYRHRAAARASMIIAGFADPDRTPFGPLPDSHGELTALLYAETLPRLVELVERPERHRHLWEDEDAVLAECEAAIAAGVVGIDERPEVDLAVVTVPDSATWSGHRFAHRRYEGIHPMAVHNASPRAAILLVADGTYRFTYRYETWVQYRSRPVRPRVALEPLAAALGAADTVAWRSDPIDDLTPELAPVDGGGSSLAPWQVLDLVVDHLATAPPAFDPYGQ